jgi:hypothetical protein
MSSIVSAPPGRKNALQHLGVELTDDTWSPLSLGDDPTRSVSTVDDLNRNGGPKKWPGGIDLAPVVSGTGQSVARGTSVDASFLFSAIDPDGSPIQRYLLWDHNADATSGHWVVNGVVQAAGQLIDLTAAEFALTKWQAGSTPEGCRDAVSIQVTDGIHRSNILTVRLITPANSAPTVAAEDIDVAAGEGVAVGSLFAAHDADGDRIIRFAVTGHGTDPASGHWVVDGEARPLSSYIEVTADQLDDVRFQTADGMPRTEKLSVRVYDGLAWSGWQDFDISTHAASHPADLLI